MPWNHYLNVENIIENFGEPNFGDIIHGNDYNSLWSIRERLFYVLFERLANTYCSIIPASYRKPLELIFLIIAVIPLIILVYIHANFIHVPVDCLTHVSKDWPRDGVLRIELNLLDSDTNCHYSRGTCAKISSLLTNSDSTYSTSKAFPIKIYASTNNQSYYEKSSIKKNSYHFERWLAENTSLISPHEEPAISYITSYASEEYINYSVWPQQKYIIEYALTYGLLKLPDTVRRKLQIPVYTVKLNPYVDTCFGNKFSRFILRYVVGFTDVLMSSLKNLVDKDQKKGFIRNVITGDQYRFVNKSLTLSSYVTAAFTMIAFTLSISMLLRYSHHQIFLFIVRMLQALEFNLNVSFPAASLLTVVFALVGMEAVMSEFFNDSTTAFYVIVIVWIADQYDTVCCHHAVTKRHWLRFFYLYHFAFYAYDYRFNGQYSGLALLTSWLFIQHSMVFFFHHFELPSILDYNAAPAHYSTPLSVYSLYLRRRSNGGQSVEQLPSPNTNS